MHFSKVFSYFTENLPLRSNTSTIVNTPSMLKQLLRFNVREKLIYKNDFITTLNFQTFRLNCETEAIRNGQRA